MSDPYSAFKDADPYAQFGDAPKAQAATPEKASDSTWSDWAKNLGSAAIRPVAKAVSSLPGMAADTGVAVRNLAYNLSHGIAPTLADFYPASSGGSHQEYELPSQSFNRALDTYTRAPTGLGKGAEFASTALLSSRLPTPQATSKLTSVMNAPADLSSKAPEELAASFKPAYTNQVVPSNFASAGRQGAQSGLTSAQQNAADVGQSLGMKLTPGQQLGSKALQQLEAKMQSQPWTSGPLNRIGANNQAVLNTAAARSIGEDANVVDSSVLARANERLGSVFENIGDPKRITAVDPAQTRAVIDGIDQQAQGLIAGSIRDNGLVQRLSDLADTGGINGEQLRQLSSKLGKAAYKQMSTPAGDRDMGQALYGVKDHVDDLIGSGLADAERGTYNSARQQYRNLMLLTSRTGIVNPSAGNVSGVSLASKLQQADKSGFLYGRNQSDLYNAARFAQAFKPIVGDSGTATRSLSLGDIASAHYGIPLNLLARAYASRLGQGAVRGLAQSPGLLQNPQSLASPIVGGLLAMQ